jgi:co-chaperonin GroES (HSP10)
MFQSNQKLNKNEWIVDPRIPDPENLPEPIGWTLLVRPYPVKQTSKGGIILIDETIDYANYLTNIGRVVKIGPCCWNRPEHRNKDGERFDWVKEGDFIEYAAHTGMKRLFKGVSYIVLMDDEVVSRLPDPLVDGDKMTMDIPQEDLEKYNTVYNKTLKGAA